MEIVIGALSCISSYPVDKSMALWYTNSINFTEGKFPILGFFFKHTNIILILTN